jgi:hypothetical protein
MNLTTIANAMQRRQFKYMGVGPATPTTPAYSQCAQLKAQSMTSLQAAISSAQSI